MTLPRCGGINETDEVQCMQCGEVIDIEKLTTVCPVCSSIMSDDWDICPVCRCDIGNYQYYSRYNNEKQYNSENVIAPEFYNTYDDNQNMYTKVCSNKKHDKGLVVGIIIGSCILFSVITAAIVIPIASTLNQRALELYDKAYENFYTIDCTYTSETTANLIGQARNTADSIFVLSDTRNQIEQLYMVAGDYTLLGEAEQYVSSNNTKAAQTRLNQIGEKEVLSSDRYKNVVNRIKSLEFKANKESWAKEELEELKIDSASTIKSWSKNYSIAYYTGLIRLENFSNIENGRLNIILEDYNGQTHELYFDYNYDAGSSWDSSMDELNKELMNNTNCVISLIATSYGKIFAYNYVLEN